MQIHVNGMKLLFSYSKKRFVNVYNTGHKLGNKTLLKPYSPPCFLMNIKNPPNKTPQGFFVNYII